MVYDDTTKHAPPEDHIKALAQSNNQPAKLAKADFGLDSLFGLLLSSVAAPLYLYASLKGKFAVWDEILDGIPDEAFRGPTLDVGCGRGMVFLKMAQRKKTLSQTLSSPSPSPSPSADAEGGIISPTYGIDIFSTADQTGNSPTATYQNAVAMGVVDFAVLHTASFVERLPFADGAFSLVTTSLALHNARREGRAAAVREMARVCRPGGRVVVVDLYGFFGEHGAVLRELGWRDVDVSLVGMPMMFGVLPCQMLSGVKPT